MSSEPNFETTAASIRQYLLGIESGADAEAPVSVAERILRQAVKEAYIAGQKEKALQDSGANTELLFWQLMDSLPDNVYFKDRRSRFICVNRSQARFLGLSDPNEAIGKSDFDFFDSESAMARFDTEQEIMDTGKGTWLQEEVDLEVGNERSCILSSKLPLHDVEGQVVGTFGISRDVSVRYLAEKEVERQRKLMEAIIEILPCRIFVRDADDRFILINEAYRAALGVENREVVIGRRLSDFQDGERQDRIYEEDQSIKKLLRPVLNKIEYDKSIFRKERWVVTSKVPFVNAEGTIEGIVGMTYDITEQKQAEEEAHRLKAELQVQHEQYEAELLVARHLQERLMSMGFDDKGQFYRRGESWTVSATYFYKPSHHLAGDFFEIIPISPDRIGVLVCDVMGHGVKAALVTMLLRGLLLDVPELLDQPQKVLTHLNNSLCALAEDQEFPRFTTAVYMMIDLRGGFARLACAGHPEPLWKTRNAEGRDCFLPCPAPESGPALGLIPGDSYLQNEFPFEGFTELLFYTDGIIEQKDALGREFGVEKLESILLNVEQESLSNQLSTINSALRLTAGSSKFDDDICLVALSLAPNA